MPAPSRGESPAMSCYHFFLHPSYTNDLESTLDFTLDFKKLENIHMGFWSVFHFNDVRKGSELINKVIIFKPFFDPRDCLAIKGMLGEDQRMGIAYVE
jgi:hypothetical protein